MIREDLTNKKGLMLKVAVQMDSPERLDKKGDSTLALIEEALKRNFFVYIYTVDNLALIDNKPVAYARKVTNINIRSEHFINLQKEKLLMLNSCDVILVRQDPPFDMNYITATHILDKVKEGIKVINKPDSIRNSPEKLFVTNFYHLMPPTVIAKKKTTILNYVKKFKKSVIKPLYGNGGKDVFYLSNKEPNLNVIVEKLLSENQHLIVQKFINNVKKGDKRILLIDGEPVGAVNRVPKGSEIRANLHIGATARKSTLNKRDLYICKQIGPFLRSKQLYFTGIDIIDGFLTEINVTSPTCIREIDKLNKTKISEVFWNKLSF